MELSNEEKWENSLKDIKSNVSAQSFRTWFESLRFVNFNDEILTLITPTQFSYDWVTEHYGTLIQKVFKAHFGNIIRTEFQTIIPTDWVYQETKEKTPKISVIKNFNEDLIRDLKKSPEIVHSVSPFEFEDLVAYLLKLKGYDIHQTPRSKDGGFDIIAKFKTPLGDNCACFVECKKYSIANPVGVGLIRSLYGVVESADVNLGMLVTTSRFTKGAREFEKRHDTKLKLKDYLDLKEWFQVDFKI